MNAGDICWVRLTFRAGEEELSCRRPAVVFQAPAVSALLPTVLVVPLASEFEALRFPGAVPVEPDAENGLTQSLVALVFQLTAVDAGLLEPTRGRVSAATLRELWKALDDLTGRNDEREAA